MRLRPRKLLPAGLVSCNSAGQAGVNYLPTRDQACRNHGSRASFSGVRAARTARPTAGSTRSAGESMAAVQQAQAADLVRIHPLVVRITHWINVLAVLMMVTSGWRIYNASPLFDFTFPDGLTLGGWLAG